MTCSTAQEMLMALQNEYKEAAADNEPLLWTKFYIDAHFGQVETLNNQIFFVKKFNAKMKTETGQETKILRTDGGGEFCSKEFEDWLGKAGIAHQVTPPYTPQLNGVAERVNRTVLESARSQMYGKKVPLELWGLAVLCVQRMSRTGLFQVREK